ncbi:patatin-like phospholipase family protein [Sedimentitalea nanhaiensis]|nr:patatin-like phospholipase family protein [Sedimentitalea nanhaiensis]
MTERRQGIPTRRATLALMGAAAVSACGVEPRIPYRPDDRAATPLLGAPYRIRTDAAIEDYPPDLGPRFRENGRSHYLAISGGGANGAFGAGVLAGWTASGTRPTFSVISGVSTGALIAPLAFLGPEHDVTLRNLYTGGVAEGIGGKPSLLGLLTRGALVDPQPLRQLVEFFVSPSLLRGVAQEHARGRRLFVFTTDLDAQLGVIWNMGAIAGSGDPGALSLFEDVLMASAAIPGAFPPIRIRGQTADGRTFEELHGDGAVVSNVFTLPETVLFSFQGQRAVGAALTDIHMLMNVNLEPEFNVVAVRPSAITARSVSTLLKYQMLRQVNATHDFAHAAGIGFHVTSIDMVAPDDVDTLEFNTAYMRALYAEGFRRARAGSAWSAALPPLEGGEAIVSAG